MSTLRMDAWETIQFCPACGQKNRTAFEPQSEISQCGRCKAELRSPAAPVEVSAEAEFYQLLEKSSLLVVVDFWAILVRTVSACRARTGESCNGKYKTASGGEGQYRTSAFPV